MKHQYKEDGKFTANMTFGEVLRKSRRLMGYNQTDFAELFGVCQNTISKWETGEYSPPFEDAQYILKRLGIKIVFKKVRDTKNEGQRRIHDKV